MFSAPSTCVQICTFCCEHPPTQVGYNDDLQSSQNFDEDNELADEHLWDAFWQFATVFFWVCKPTAAAAFGWLVSDDHGGEHAGWRSWTTVVTLGLRLRSRLEVLPNSKKCIQTKFMVEKLTFSSQAMALADISVVSIPNARSLKSCNLSGYCVIKLYILEWPFIVTACTIIMLSHYIQDLFGWWRISAGEMLTNADLDRFVVWEKEAFCLCVCVSDL